MFLVKREHYMRKYVIVLLIAGLILSVDSLAQEPQNNEKVVTLVVNGTGQTKEEATKNALRSAIEQAFGTFVSANTEVLNDELIKDEITTVSTGNIKSFKELSVSQTSNGLYDASVQATVSIDQLTKFAQSKGMQAELAGATFVMNMKMRELNKKNELLAIDHMIEKAKAIAKNGLFDYKLEIGEPQFAGNPNYSIKIKILFCENENTKLFYKTIYETLKALSLSEADKVKYQEANLGYYSYNKQLIENDDVELSFFLRNKYQCYEGYGRYTDFVAVHYAGDYCKYPWIMPMFVEATLDYVIKDNLSNEWYCCIVNSRNREEKLISVWKYGCKNDNSYHHFILSPSERILTLNGFSKDVSNYTEYDTSIMNYGSGSPDYFNFNPMERSHYGDRENKVKQRQKTRIYFEQSFHVMYSEDELSRLKSITIEHRKH